MSLLMKDIIEADRVRFEEAKDKHSMWRTVCQELDFASDEDEWYYYMETYNGN